MVNTMFMVRSWFETTLARKLDDRAASLVEYALLLALIALICIAALTVLGGNVSNKFNDTGNSFAGM